MQSLGPWKGLFPILDTTVFKTTIWDTGPEIPILIKRPINQYWMASWISDTLVLKDPIFSSLFAQIRDTGIVENPIDATGPTS